MRLRVLEDGVVDHEAPPQALVFGAVLEALLLQARAVDDVGSRDDLAGQGGALVHQFAGTDERLPDVGGKGEGRRGDELDVHVVVLEKFDEGVDRAAMAEVADEGYVQAIYGSQLFPYREKIQEGLSGVLQATVATVYDGNGAEFGRNGGAGFVRMPQYDGVTVAA